MVMSFISSTSRTQMGSSRPRADTFPITAPCLIPKEATDAVGGGSLGRPAHPGCRVEPGSSSSTEGVHGRTAGAGGSERLRQGDGEALSPIPTPPQTWGKLTGIGAPALLQTAKGHRACGIWNRHAEPAGTRPGPHTNPPSQPGQEAPV